MTSFRGSVFLHHVMFFVFSLNLIDAVLSQPMDRVAKMDALSSMNSLSTRLKEFIAAKVRDCKDPKQVIVTKEDIAEFFASLPTAKKRRN